PQPAVPHYSMYALRDLTATGLVSRDARAREPAFPCPADGSGRVAFSYRGAALSVCRQCSGVWLSGAERLRLEGAETDVGALHDGRPRWVDLIYQAGSDALEGSSGVTGDGGWADGGDGGDGGGGD